MSPAGPWWKPPLSPLPAALGLSVVALTLAVFWQAGTHSFVNIDDDLHVYQNPWVRGGITGPGLVWALTTAHASNWQPLTWLSHMLDVELFGMDPWWHHRVNVGLHAANALLVFLVFARMTGAPWRSGLVAALFAVHPLHVESVAWVTERKDVLSTAFGMLSLASYLAYVRRPGLGRYLGAFGFFALALLAKPMLVTLPFVFLLLDVWPLGRLASVPVPPGTPAGPEAPVRRLLLEKVPLLLLSAACCVVTYATQQHAGFVLDSIPFGSRLANALVSYLAYLGLTVWPGSLAIFYPHPAILDTPIPGWKVAAAATTLVLATALVVWQLRRRPHLAVGWFWYLGTLVPVIGLVQAGEQAMADRYTYVPLIGVFVVVAWGVPDLLSRRRWRTPMLAAGAAGALAALSAVSWFQVGRWRNSTTLFQHALDVTEENYLAHNNLGVALANQGRLDQAIPHFRDALRIRPDYVEAHYNLALALTRQGRRDEADPHLREALRLEAERSARRGARSAARPARPHGATLGAGPAQSP